MRILHTSDWHIGRTLLGADLRESVDAFASWLLTTVEERRIDLLLASIDHRAGLIDAATKRRNDAFDNAHHIVIVAEFDRR